MEPANRESKTSAQGGQDSLEMSNPSAPDVDVRNFGALGDGETDDQNALVAALDYCAANGTNLYLPAGVYLHSGQLSLVGIRLHGDGKSSELRATHTTNSAINVSGTDPIIERICISCVPGTRQLTATSDGIVVRSAHRYLIRDNHLRHCARMGIFQFNSTDGRVSGNRITSTNADGIHLGGGCHRVSIFDNVVSHSGDDAIASVGTTTVNSDLSIHDNLLSDGSARAVTVIGATRVNVRANRATGFTHAAAMAIGNDAIFGGLGASSVTVARNTFHNSGSQAPHNAMIQLSSTHSQPLHALTLQSNLCTGSGAWFLQCVGAGFRDFRIEDNTFDSNSRNSAFEFTGLTNCQFLENRVRNIASYAITADGSCGGTWLISGNQFEDINTAGDPHVDCINLDDITFTQCSIHDNRLEQRKGLSVERFVEALRTRGVSATGNAGLSFAKLGYTITNPPRSP